MTQDEAKKLDHGLYRIWWKGGGSSLAAVGSLYDGTRWFAATNWTSSMTDNIACPNWRLVERVERFALNA